MTDEKKDLCQQCLCNQCVHQKGYCNMPNSCYSCAEFEGVVTHCAGFPQTLVLNVNVQLRQGKDGLEILVDNIGDISQITPELLFNRWHRLTINGEAVMLHMHGEAAPDACKTCICKDCDPPFCLRKGGCDRGECSKTVAIDNCDGFRHNRHTTGRQAEPEACKTCICKSCDPPETCQLHCDVGPCVKVFPIHSCEHFNNKKKNT